jgi:malate:Na+ symporter
VTTIAAAVVTAVTLYLIGALTQRLFSFPAAGGDARHRRDAQARARRFAVAAARRLSRLQVLLDGGHLSSALRHRRIADALGQVVAAFTLPYLITIVSTVVSIIATGFFVGGWLKMYPIDTAIVTACHSGQGGTGDVAILTAGNRMQLMPFAQIATRIGGAATVTLVLIILTQIG